MPVETGLATRWEGRGFADLLAASAAGVSRGMPEAVPTRQMSDPKGSELAGYLGRNSQLPDHGGVTGEHRN